jgi:hypothetical protein
MGLHHDRASGGQGGGGVAPRDAEGKREVAGREDRHRADRKEHASEVRSGWDEVGTGLIDPGLDVPALLHQVREHSQLTRGTGHLCPEALRTQRGLPLRYRDGCVDDGVQLVRQRVEQRSRSTHGSPASSVEGSHSRRHLLLHVGLRRLLDLPARGPARPGVEAGEGPHEVLPYRRSLRQLCDPVNQSAEPVDRHTDDVFLFRRVRGVRHDARPCQQPETGGARVGAEQ